MTVGFEQLFEQAVCDAIFEVFGVAFVCKLCQLHCSICDLRFVTITEETLEKALHF